MLCWIRYSLMIFGVIAISSCSVLSPVQVGPTSTYLVDTAPVVPVARKHSHVTLLVAAPEVSPIYATADMAYTTMSYQVNYFVKNSWAESPSHMLQPLIADALLRSHAYHAVNLSAASGHVDYVVNTRILQFEQDFRQPNSVFRLALRVQIMNAATQHVIATKDILMTAPAPQNTPYGGVVAANRATARALLVLARFVADVI